MLGEQIKAERLHRGLTITELAKAAAISYQNLWNYENSGVNPPKDKLFRIVAALIVAFLKELGIKAMVRATLAGTHILIAR